MFYRKKKLNFRPEWNGMGMGQNGTETRNGMGVAQNGIDIHRVGANANNHSLLQNKSAY